MGKVIDFIKSNIRIILVLVILVIFGVVYYTKYETDRKLTYTVVEGEIEHSEETNLFILKNETLVDYDKAQPVTAIVDQGKRASKNEAIAIYQNESYDEYLKQIGDIDSQIQLLVKDLPKTYSADINNIEQAILKYSNDVKGTSSYLKMQEYKTKLDELAYKKILLLANASPDNSAIRDLINKREELVRLSKVSDNNIFSPITGIVTYKVDNVEDVIDFNSIIGYNPKNFENIISAYSDVTNSEFGIKIIDNFEAYLLVKTTSGANDEYIKEGKKYKIRIADLENQTITATLVKNVKEGEYNYSLFKMNNEIDSLVDYRKLSCEIVWKTDSGMALPLNAIYEDEVKHYKYVLMVFGTEYVKVPINIICQSDSIAIVENVEKDKYEEYGLDSSFKLELYDELVIEPKTKQ